MLGRGYTKEFKAKAVAHYKDSGSIRKTAEAFGISKTSVLKWARGVGVDTSHACAVEHTEEFKTKVVEHYRDSGSIIKTAEAFGVGPMSVHNWVRKAGVDTTRKPDPNRCVKQYLRTCSKYRAWRKRVIARDGWKCRHCGSTRRLHVDHITPFNELFNRAKGRLRNKDKIREACLNYAPMWRANNGRVLCEDCHKQTATWGSGSTDGAQVDLI